MDFHPEKCVAVVTGDFVGFSGLDRTVRSRMPQVIVDAGRSVNKAFGPIVYGDVDVFRGDGWQALIVEPRSALRAALFFRAYIIGVTEDRGVDTRIAIGVGPVDYVPPEKIAAGDGAAYRVSGKLLGKMGSARAGRIRCAFADGSETGSAFVNGLTDGDLIDCVVRLAGAMGDNWRSRRALAVTGALKGWSHDRIARHWPGQISRQAVGKHLQKAGWHAIAHALVVFERKMQLWAENDASGTPCPCKRP